jgi:hypothetical protein
VAEAPEYSISFCCTPSGDFADDEADDEAEGPAAPEAGAVDLLHAVSNDNAITKRSGGFFIAPEL